MENNLKLPKTAEIKFFASAEYQRKIEAAKFKMRAKPFVERFKNINLIAQIGTVFFPIISVITAIAFLYNYINGAINYTYISIGISLIILAFLELVKNNLLNNGLHTYFSNSGKSTLVFLFALLFSIGSFILSYNGAELLVKGLDKSKELIIDNTSNAVANINKNTSKNIADEKKKIADLRNKAKKQWRGLNTPEQNKLILVYEQNIKQYRDREQKNIDMLITDKKDNISKAETSVNYNAYVFKIFAGINEFLTILSIVFVSFYSFKTVRQDMDLHDFKNNPNKYNEIPNSKDFKQIAIDTNIPKHSLNASDERHIIKGFLKPQHSTYNDERTKENNNKRTCKNCGNEFDFKHWNKQYCSDACRIEHWENKTGKKLKLKKAK